MPTNRNKRLARERIAADFLHDNHSRIAGIFEDVARDLGAEMQGLSKATRTARQAAEMAHRLDQLVDLSGISPLAEALDYFGFFLASLGFLAIVDAVENAAKRRKQKITRLQDRLQGAGSRLSRLSKARLERRIAKLEAKP